MSKVSMTVKQIKELGLWDKVSEFCGINPWALNEGRISENEVLEFDTEFKKPVIEIPKSFNGECYIIMDARGNFVYGECEEAGNDFEMAQKFNDFDGAMRFINHNEEYDSDHWKIFRVKINYEIGMDLLYD